MPSSNHQYRLKKLEDDLGLIKLTHLEHKDSMIDVFNDCRSMRSDLLTVETEFYKLRRESINERRKKDELKKQIRQLNSAVFGLIIVLSCVVLLGFLIVSSLL